MANLQSHSERVLILAPIGRDSALASSILGEAGIAADVVANLANLVGALDCGAGAAIVTEEAAGITELDVVSTWLAGSQRGRICRSWFSRTMAAGRSAIPGAAKLAGVLGNVTFLERPFHPTTLVSMVATALRGRRRQYEARARIDEVREGEARLRVALKAGRLGSWIWNVDSGELLCSDRCKAIFGRKPDQTLTYDELRQAVHPDDREAMQDAAARAVATGEDYEVEYRTIWPDGSLHWAEVRARLAKGADGRPAQMIGVSQDITERKRLEETLAARVRERTAELEASERRFRAVFDSAFQMAMLVDLEGRVMLANLTALTAVDSSSGRGRRHGTVASAMVVRHPAGGAKAGAGVSASRERRLRPLRSRLGVSGRVAVRARFFPEASPRRSRRGRPGGGRRP